MTNIEKLLRKRKPKGEEIGKALIESLCYTYKSMKEGKGELTLFTGDDLEKMISRLPNEIEYSDYRRYVRLDNYIVASRPAHSKTLLRILDTIDYLGDKINNVRTCENALKQIVQLPLIATNDFYNSFDDAKKEIMNKKGVALLTKESEATRNDIIKNGYCDYDEHISDYLDRTIGVYSFTDKNKSCEELNMQIHNKINNLETDIYYLQGVNTIYDLTIKYTGIEELQILKYNLSTVYDCLKELYDIIDLVKTMIENRDIQNETIRKEKISILNEVFRPVKTDYKIPKDNLLRADELISDRLYGFVNDDCILETLLMDIRYAEKE